MNRTSPVTTVTITIGLVVVLVLLNLVGALQPVAAVVGVVLKPVTAVLNPGSGGALERENRALHDEVGQLKAEVAKREEAKLQNDALRNQLTFAQNNNYKLVGADIISQDPTNYQQVLTIDHGSSAGIKKGMVVVTQGLLVGRIIEETPTTAKVYLITDFGSAIPATAQQTRASGLVRGQRGFGLGLEMVPQTESLQAGDTVLTSGFGGDYPRGLVLGTIGEIRRRDTDVYQTAIIRPAIDFRKLESVFVITGST